VELGILLLLLLKEIRMTDIAAMIPARIRNVLLVPMSSIVALSGVDDRAHPRFADTIEIPVRTENVLSLKLELMKKSVPRYTGPNPSP
jgi:hypothetical protein